MEVTGPFDIKQPRRSLKSYLVERAQSDMEVIGTSSITSAEYLASITLDQSFMQFIQKNKNLIDDYVYMFRVELKNFGADERVLTWNLRRRYVDFIVLCKEINKELKKAKVGFKAPHPPLLRSKTGDRQIYLESLALFLNSLLKDKDLRQNSQVLYDFLETSLLPLPDGPKVYKEGFLFKRSGGRYSESRFQTYSGLICKRWLKRWFIVSEEGLLYTVDSNSNKIREMLMFDQSFRIEYGRKLTGSYLGLTVITPTRKLNLKACDLFQAVDWIASIQEAVAKSAYVKINRYFSFAPTRNPTSYCKPYIDGESYFSDVHDALLKATKEVFIAGWWVSPELYLKRPVQSGNIEARLDSVLKRIADRGVKICILVYREVKLALYNDSAYTKNALQALSPNIRVLRHPKEFLFLWSHHEKLVIIDHHVAFLGGLDLCYGRLDLNSHPLHDPTLEENGVETFPGIDYSNPRITDFRNVRVHHTSSIKKNETPRLPWHDVAVMVIGEPTKDIARHFIQCWNFAQIDLKGKRDYFITPKVSAKSPSKSRFNKLKTRVKDMFKSGSPSNKYATQSVDQMNNDQRFDLYVQNKANDIYSPPKFDRNYSKLDVSIQIYKYNENVVKEEEEEQIKGFRNLVANSHENPKSTRNITTLEPVLKPTGDQHSPQLTPNNSARITFKDVVGGTQEMPENGKKPTLKIQMTSLEESKEVKFEEQMTKELNHEYISLLKKCRTNQIIFDQTYGLKTPKPPRPRQSLIFTFQQQEEKEEEKEEKPQKINDHFYEENMLQPMWTTRPKSKTGTCECQVLRSASNWSLGLNSDKNYLENSIQNAYIETIQNAKSFIYIENQFFISGTAGDPVGNQIAQALVLRIEKAHLLKENFRVVVFLPLVPAFEGEIDDPKSTVLRIQLHWQFQTITRGSKSVFSQLHEKGIPDPAKYIEFYSLRQHAKLNNVPVTEMIYIHTKLMIVDDNVVILGSANINDRSMQGSRDSEIAIIIEDSKKMASVMDSKEVLLGEFAYNLRKNLWMEHLNLPEQEVQDPLNPQLINKMKQTAERHTQIYREVFACYPDDNIQRLSEIREFKKRANLDKYNTLSAQIQSHIVQFPLHFLAKENLTFSVTNKEYYVPEINFT